MAMREIDLLGDDRFLQERFGMQNSAAEAYRPGTQNLSTAQSNYSIPSEFPDLYIGGTGTLASQAAAATAAEGQSSLATGSAATTAEAPSATTNFDSFGTTAMPETVGLANGVMSASDILAALHPQPAVGDPSQLSVANPEGAPEASAPSSDQLSQVASSTALITTDTNEQGTGTIVNYNGANYLVTDGHVTGTNPDGIADGTNTPAANVVTATTSDGIGLTLGQGVAAPDSDLVAYPITGSTAPINGIQMGDSSSLSQGQSMYSVNYGDGQLQANSGTYLGDMPAIYWFNGISPDAGRDVGNTTMSANPGASGAGMITFDANGNPVYSGTLDYGNGNGTQFTNTNALKNLLDSASTNAGANAGADAGSGTTPPAATTSDTTTSNPGDTPAPSTTPVDTSASAAAAAAAPADTATNPAIDPSIYTDGLDDLAMEGALSDLGDLYQFD